MKKQTQVSQTEGKRDFPCRGGLQKTKKKHHMADDEKMLSEPVDPATDLHATKQLVDQTQSMSCRFWNQQQVKSVSKATTGELHDAVVFVFLGRPRFGLQLNPSASSCARRERPLGPRKYAPLSRTAFNRCPRGKPHKCSEKTKTLVMLAQVSTTSSLTLTWPWPILKIHSGLEFIFRVGR